MPSFLSWSLLFKIEHSAISGPGDDRKGLEQGRFSLGGRESD